MEIKPCFSIGGKGEGAGEVFAFLRTLHRSGTPKVPAGAIIAYQSSLVELAAFDDPSRFESEGRCTLLEEDDQEFFPRERFDTYRVLFEEAIRPGFGFAVVFNSKDETLPIFPRLSIKSLCAQIEIQDACFRVLLFPLSPGSDDRGNWLQRGSFKRAIHRFAEDMTPK